jgi:hypothetical protein
MELATISEMEDASISEMEDASISKMELARIALVIGLYRITTDGCGKFTMKCVLGVSPTESKDKNYFLSSLNSGKEAEFFIESAELTEFFKEHFAERNLLIEIGVFNSLSQVERLRLHFKCMNPSQHSLYCTTSPSESGASTFKVLTEDDVRSLTSDEVGSHIGETLPKMHLYDKVSLNWKEFVPLFSYEKFPSDISINDVKN